MSNAQDSILAKICTQCGEAKPATTEYFSRYARGYFGLNACCKVCRRQQGRIEVQCPGCKRHRFVRMSDWKKRTSDLCRSCQVRHRVGLAPEPTPSGKGTRLYNIWRGLRQRCGYIKGGHAHDQQHYADRGIDVCEPWRVSFAAFEAWALQNGYAEHLVLDRAENDKDYCPENCRWVTILESNRNKRTTLPPAIREAIITACASGATQRSQARLYAVPESTISLLVRGKTYARDMAKSSR